eukprot:4644131-Amphidinium_carterae.2
MNQQRESMLHLEWAIAWLASFLFGRPGPGRAFETRRCCCSCCELAGVCGTASLTHTHTDCTVSHACCGGTDKCVISQLCQGSPSAEREETTGNHVAIGEGRGSGRFAGERLDANVDAAGNAVDFEPSMLPHAEVSAGCNLWVHFEKQQSPHGTL